MPPIFEIATTAPDEVKAVGSIVGAGLEEITLGASVDAGEAELRGFTGAVGDVLVRPGSGRVEILVGAGEVGAVGALQVRRAAASFARALSKAPTAALDLRGLEPEGMTADRVVQAALEGVALASYSIDRYRSSPPERSLTSVTLVVAEESLAAAQAGLARGQAIADAVCWARDMSNRVPGDVTPRVLADEATAVAERGGARIEVLDEVAAETERLGGLLGVARGSDEPPRLLRLTYEPSDDVARRDSEGKVPTVVLVGKGITFDSGGLSLKTADGMIGMKTDMSGAAAVIAVAGACRALGVGIRVVAIAPVTENMPGGRAIKPGDVLTIRNGKTIEVLNTDAEGRLVLADGLVLATEQEPDAIVDIATLTGPCIVALGMKVAGVMGNDSGVVGAVERSAAAVGEPVWRLPLPRDYRKDIDSEIADMKNMGKPRQAGALVAGLLLQEFVDDRPWAHLDIAGPSQSEEERFEVRRGSTGFGVRTLIEFVESFEPTGGRPADHVGVG